MKKSTIDNPPVLRFKANHTHGGKLFSPGMEAAPRDFKMSATDIEFIISQGAADWIVEDSASTEQPPIEETK